MKGFETGQRRSSGADGPGVDGGRPPSPVDAPPQGGALAGGSAGNVLPGKNPTLLPTPSLSPDEFEDFTERLLSAHRFCAEPLRRVARVERWGRRGDKQDGIDFEGEFSDGSTACWQCKRYDRLDVSDVTAAVRACTFTADEYYLVFSGEASRDARVEIRNNSGWQLLDQRGLGRLVNDLPLHKRRDVLDATFGVQRRKLLLAVPGEDAFLTLEAFAAGWRDPDMVLNHIGPRVGRESELATLTAALDRSRDWPAVVMVIGPGGRGKTRLLVEAFTEFQRANPQNPIIFLSPGRIFDTAALSELPHTPAIIVVDDAHQDPTAMVSLLHYVTSTEGTQLVLASRPTGTGPLQTVIRNAGYVLSDDETIEVAPLSKPQARSLVASLTEGLGLVLAMREYLAEQAIDSPHVAVIAANLIHRGELTAPLGVDASLRNHVLARYRDFVARDINGYDRKSVRRLLAVYAALGPVDDADDHLRNTIAAFCRLDRTDMLRLSQDLRDRGVLVTRNSLTRVVPDVLADDILEKEAAVGRDSTGFVQELWRTFGDGHAERLVTTISELDWRLTRQGGPSVIGPVWDAVRVGLRVADYDDLYQALENFKEIAATQPHALVEVLEEIGARLEETDSVGEISTIPSSLEATVATTSRVGDGTNETFEVETAQSRSAVRALVGLPPLGADDLRKRMPELYGRCATSAPELLETVLDALWELRRRDPRPTNQYTEHAERIIIDRLANLGKLPDPSFPSRIVDRVNQWLAEPPRDGDVTTPMFALQPLLAKEGEQVVAETRHSLRFRPFAISASWAGPVRDAIRATLRDQACGVDLHRAGRAVELLGEALHPPTGSFGRTVSHEEIQTWETDDLDTLAVFHDAAERTGSAVIRRMIRHEIARTAEQATSLPVRQRALTLMTDLDERNDDLAELLLHDYSYDEPSRRGTPVLTLEELEAAELTRIEDDKGLSREQAQAVQSTRLNEIIARRDAGRQILVEDVVRGLIASDNPAQVVHALDECSREICAVDPNRSPSLRAVARHLAETRPYFVHDMVSEIAVRSAGPLDKCLYILLDAWADHDEAAVITWLTTLSERRTEVRLGVATAFVTFDWTDRCDAFVEVHHRGMQDPDPMVRDRFMMGSHKLILTQPTKTVEFLLTNGITRSAAKHALQLAFRHINDASVRNLSHVDATAVLKLIDRAGWDDYAVWQIAGGLARIHAELVLDYLAATHPIRQRTPSGAEALVKAFEEQIETLIQWLVKRTEEAELEDAAAVVHLAIGDRMSPAQAQHLTNAIDTLDDERLIAFTTLLRGIPIWSLRQPHLARYLIVKARRLRGNILGRVHEELLLGMSIRSWTGVNGVSEELKDAKALASRALADESDPQLISDFRLAVANIEAQIASDRRLYEDDEL